MSNKFLVPGLDNFQAEPIPTPFRKCYNFDGVQNNDKVEYPGAICSEAVGSMSCWYKATAIDNQLRTLFNIGSTGTGGLFLWSDRGAGEMGITYGTGGAVTSINFFTPVAGFNYYFGVTWEGSTVEIWINANLEFSASDANFSAWPATRIVGDGGAADRNMFGKVTEIRTYDIRLVQDNWKWLAGIPGGTKPPTTNNIAKYECREDSGTVSIDARPGGNDGTITTNDEPTFFDRWGPPNYSDEADDYFNRAEALGGSFDLSSINIKYHRDYIKGITNELVKNLKDNNLWLSGTEYYLLGGVTFNGLRAKLKYINQPALTNSGFLAADYLAAGSGTGLKGNGSSKYLGSSVGLNAIPVSNSHISGYVTESPATTSARVIAGAETDVGVNRLALNDTVNGSITRYSDGAGFNSLSETRTSAAEFRIGSKSGSDVSLTINQDASIVGTDATTRVASSRAINVFALNDGNGSPAGHSNERMSFVSVGPALDATQRANLATIVNNWMMDLDSNAWAPL